MIALFLSSFCAVFIFLILGAFFSKQFSIECNLIITTLLGLVLTNTVCCILSFFIPIDHYVLIALLLVCIGLFFFVKDKILFFISDLLKSNKVVLLLSAPFIVLALILSIDPPLIYDAALYHIQSIKWIGEYSVVPGLANLHGRFGFNPNIFLLFSLTSLKFIFHQEIFSINFLLWALFLFYSIQKVYFNLITKGISTLFLFNFFVLISYTGLWLSFPEPNILLGLTLNLSTPTPDFISITFPLFILVHSINVFFENKGQWKDDYIILFILSVYVITVKLSALPILIAPFFILLTAKKENKLYYKLFIVSSIILIPWLLRNVILSGWLIYPFPSLDLFSFDWEVPRADVVFEKENVTGWARDPSSNCIKASRMSLGEWFPFWWHKFKWTQQLLYILSFAAPAIVLLLVLLRLVKLHKQLVVIILTSLIGVLFWFFLAPDIRFGQGFIVVAAVIPLGLYNVSLMPFLNKFFNMLILGYLLYVAMTNVLKITIGSDLDVYERALMKAKMRLYKPQKIETPKDYVFNSITVNGLEVYYPEGDDRCYDHPLPCSTSLIKTLRARGGRIQDGFRKIGN